MILVRFLDLLISLLVQIISNSAPLVKPKNPKIPKIRNHSVMGGAVARQPKEPRYAETMVVLVIVIVIITPRWNCSYHPKNGS